MWANSPLVNPTDETVIDYWKWNDPPTCSCTQTEFSWWKADFIAEYQITRVLILPVNQGHDVWTLGNSEIKISGQYCGTVDYNPSDNDWVEIQC